MGWVFMLGSDAVAWCSKKKQITTLLSTKAKYMSVTSAACEAVWLRRLLDDLGEKHHTCAGNKSAISIAKNSIIHGCTKHTDTRYHFICDLVKDSIISIIHCSTHEQVTDILTKGLQNHKFKYFREAL